MGLGSLPDEVGFSLLGRPGMILGLPEMRRVFPSLTVRWKPEGRDSARYGDKQEGKDK
jgi:hypothetical protein